MQLNDKDQIATGYDEKHDGDFNRQEMKIGGYGDGDEYNQKNLGQENRSKVISKQQHQLQDEKQLIYQQNVTVINDKNFITKIADNNTESLQQKNSQSERQQSPKNEEISAHREGETKQLQQKLSTLTMGQNNKQQQQKNLHTKQKQEKVGIDVGRQKQQQNQLDVHDNNNNNFIQQLKTYTTQPQTITRFHEQHKSPTITINQHLNQAQQSKYYFQNFKLSLTQPITSMDSTITFRIDNLKYCVGVGVGLKEVVQKHGYDYKSTTTNQLGHGLYIVTTQGYTWSHSQTEQDDVFRGMEWKNLYTGANITVKLQGEILTFKFKKSSFTMILPSRIREKYTLAFCVYLHEKTDAVSIVS